MIELPEAAVIARQIQATLSGKRILEGGQGNAPHKFAFYTGSAEYYAETLKDKVITGAQPNGRMIRVTLDSGHILVLGEGGEQILYHTADDALPKKYQFWLRFADRSCLTVSVQGWGAALLFAPGEINHHSFAGRQELSPLDEGYTYDYFLGLFQQLKATDSASAKTFMITKPGVWGVGNGILQDILLVAHLHPRRRMVALTQPERRRLFDAIHQVISQAAAQGGRDTEVDLFGRPGAYRKLLDSRNVGLPCPQCGATILKESYLGGAVYTCPDCQKDQEI